MPRLCASNWAVGQLCQRQGELISAVDQVPSGWTTSTAKAQKTPSKNAEQIRKGTITVTMDKTQGLFVEVSFVDRRGAGNDMLKG